MELSALAGNLPLKRRLEQETGRRGLSHAYMICGPAGSGKRTLAGLLAAALVCVRDVRDAPCGVCAPCRKAMGGIHPDILRIGGDGKDITVAQIRALRSDAYIRPNEAQRKVYVLENAQSMNASAQNAMLKLLEEGPAYGAFLLLSEHPAALLETVRSRCEILTLAPVTQGEAEEWLQTRYPDRSPAELREAAGQCGGLLGRAAELLEGDPGRDQAAADGAAALVRAFAKGDELGLMELCISLEKWDRDRLELLLEEAILLLRDALALSVGAPAADPRRQTAAAEAARLPQRTLAGAADKLERLRLACGSNVGAGHLAGWLCAGLNAAGNL